MNVAPCDDHSLRRALKADVLKSDLSMQELQRILTTAYERHPRWTVHLDKIVSKAHFLRYAARYVRRPSIAQWRLLRVTDREVEFVAKDRGGLSRRVVSFRNLHACWQRTCQTVTDMRFAILGFWHLVQKGKPTLLCSCCWEKRGFPARND
jgi:hypothetical protein